jgi:hypothetical protein
MVTKKISNKAPAKVAPVKRRTPKPRTVSAVAPEPVVLPIEPVVAKAEPEQGSFFTSIKLAFLRLFRKT